MSHLLQLEIQAIESGRPRTEAGLAALAWADCLLRSRRPHYKRIQDCCRMLRREFGL